MQNSIGPTTEHWGTLYANSRSSLNAPLIDTHSVFFQSSKIQGDPMPDHQGQYAFLGRWEGWCGQQCRTLLRDRAEWDTHPSFVHTDDVIMNSYQSSLSAVAFPVGRLLWIH